MSQYSRFSQRLLAAGTLVVLLLGLESLSHGNPCRPPTPSPCGADGVCRPIRPTWGFSTTRWRPWPGEPMSQPTPATGEAGGEEGERQLKPFELPTPEKEDLRGPAKSPKKQTDGAVPEADGSAEEEAPIEIPEIPTLPGAPPEALPGAQPVPGFDLEGSNRAKLPAPSLDDSPPALPPSLRQAALSLNTSQPVAHWEQPVALPLVNPASAIVIQPATEPLQQAIYIEASDQ